MLIDWPAFTPWRSLAGGALIGLAAAMLVLLNGRIAGISGVLGGLFRPSRHDVAWRVAFILALLGASAVHGLIAEQAPIHVATGPGILALAGLLVGLGTRYGAGCTSGHGVCGLSRLSPRSLAATAVFMVCGFATVFVVRHVLHR